MHSHTLTTFACNCMHLHTVTYSLLHSHTFPYNHRYLRKFTFFACILVHSNTFLYIHILLHTFEHILIHSHAFHTFTNIRLNLYTLTNNNVCENSSHTPRYMHSTTFANIHIHLRKLIYIYSHTLIQNPV